MLEADERASAKVGYTHHGQKSETANGPHVPLLIGYEINAQEWKKRLGLEGVGGGYILKIVIAKGGTISIGNYFGG